MMFTCALQALNSCIAMQPEIKQLNLIKSFHKEI